MLDFTSKIRSTGNHLIDTLRGIPSEPPKYEFAMPEDEKLKQDIQDLADEGKSREIVEKAIAKMPNVNPDLAKRYIDESFKTTPKK